MNSKKAANYLKRAEDAVQALYKGHASTTQNTMVQLKEFLAIYAAIGGHQFELRCKEEDDEFTLYYNTVTDLLKSVAVMEAAHGAVNSYSSWMMPAITPCWMATIISCCYSR